jgi:rod shape determining protein RodA
MKTLNWRQFDFVLLLACLALIGLGVTLIYSGSLGRYNGDEPLLSEPVVKQLIFAAVGLVVMVAVARFDYRALSPIAPALYALTLVGLVVVLAIADPIFGSRRWVEAFGIQFQPSEPGKLAAIVLLARVFSATAGRSLPGRTLLITLALAALPALLVFVEPDLGTAIVFGTIWLGMAFVAGARPRHLLLLVGSAVVLFPFLLLVALHGYQRERIAVFLDPSRDPLGSGFNINQAAISIGSGGLFGKGLTQGTQTQLEFLRTQTTDFIFSVLGEELGFAGAVLLFALFFLLLARGVRAAGRARDPFGRLVATGIVVMILTQMFINVGVNVHIFPVTGIPLPFISQGGSSLISMFVAVGLLQSIIMRQRAVRAEPRTVSRLPVTGLPR